MENKQLFSSSGSSIKRPKRKILWVIPLLLLLTAAIFAFIFRDKLLPAKDVVAVRAITVKNSGDSFNASAEDKVLFQAAGWLEADPYAVYASALVSGVVKEVYVIGGQDIVKGQKIAELDSENFKLAVDELKVAILSANTDVEKAKTLTLIKDQEMTQLKFSLLTLSSKIAKAKDLAGSLTKAGDSVSGLETSQAILAVKEIESLKAETANKIEILKAERKALLADEKVVEARIKVLAQKLKYAELQLSRTVIYAPVSGRVLHLHAFPGRKQMLGSDNEKSTAILSIFDSKKLQVRVDIPLADAGGIFIGQRALINLDFLSEDLTGEITSIFGHGDIQKNTIQVKVRVNNPVDRLRPEMLARVKFFGKKSKVVKKESSEFSVFIHKDCLFDIKDNTAKVWNIEKGKAQLKNIEFTEADDNWVKVDSGVNSGAKIIYTPEGIESDDRVRIIRYREK